MSDKTVLILQHVPNENAGTILDYLKSRSIPHRAIPLYEKDAVLPESNSVGAVIVMGGPMNVYEEDKHPFLKREDAFIKKVIQQRIPYLGVCLGAQLLAKAMGARVYKASTPEMGWGDVALTPQAAQDELFGQVQGKKLRVLQWHEDTFDLPKGAVLLASSKEVPHQAYCCDGLFYGFQFHVEANRPMLEDWFKNRSDLDDILIEFDGYSKKLTQITDRIYSSFFTRLTELVKAPVNRVE